MVDYSVEKEAFRVRGWSVTSFEQTRGAAFYKVYTSGIKNHSKRKRLIMEIIQIDIFHPT